MGWGNCGTDSRGRPIGYNFDAVCDYLGCYELIDRGLAYACGGMHGQNEHDCEGYFCHTHLIHAVRIPDSPVGQLCLACNERLEATNGDEDA